MAALLPKLSHLQQYRQNEVLKRYAKDYPHNHLPPESAWQELMKYFWLCQKHKLEKEQFPDSKQLDFVCSMHREMHELDDMWHSFLLYTKDYHAFCSQYFGQFIHHVPSAEDKKNKIGIDDFEAKLRAYLNYINQHLGAETLRIWFSPLLA